MHFSITIYYHFNNFLPIKLYFAALGGHMSSFIFNLSSLLHYAVLQALLLARKIDEKALSEILYDTFYSHGFKFKAANITRWIVI